jgi:hypothetical protein
MLLPAAPLWALLSTVEASLVKSLFLAMVGMRLPNVGTR